MSVKSKNTKSNLKKVDKHKIKPIEYEELPELTDNMMSRAVYMVDGKVEIPPKRRGKQKTPTKVGLYIRLPQSVVHYFKEEGSGWQGRIGVVLEQYIKRHPHK